ncbi:homoserine dehydrogenase [Campylobacter avium LMG 24591]|uniref:Homoserine dehydrogenase n=1 Tax=Campylobacter avium LMG 24591 TaxID=522484 RepID=A0A222MZM9_9BACT|nr:homoserine dehydrogenase [Campylobacter avium]ASQ31158.1 homoserine dehydrogenase [Campylobacter avium LMG 24591]OYD78542.1 homoserine dehydrogenase [Campylobacter avium]
MKIALLGYGTVGSAVAKVLLENQEIISARCGQILEPVIALARSKKPNSLVPVVNDINEILKRDDIDIYIELMGGIDEPFKLVSKLLKRKKPVVSANKAMLAYHRYELETLAKDTFFGYEASVAGGIPIIRILKEGLSANNIISIKAILNGTSNFILSSMKQKNTSFAEALKEAQNLGYAEADPSFDINGDDAAHKLLILSSIAYGLKAKPEDILIEGISKISADDMYFADEFDLVIKLLGVAKAKNGKIELRVNPSLLPKNTMLAKVDGVMNAISISGDMLKESLYYGEGAGGEATASAVISDIMEFARNSNSSKLPMLGFSSKVNFSLIEKDEIYAKYYLRLRVEDKLGVLSKITKLMCDNEISVDIFLQKPKGKESTLFFTTHHTYERSIKNLIQALKQQDFMKDEVFMMRMENGT